jgi:hypothetical protein
MKKLETLKKTLETVDSETLKAIIENDDVIIEALTNAEKMSVLMFNEIAKAINCKEYKIVLDCNYANSKNKTLLVTYYRLAVANCMIQVYCNTRNAFRICTSANEANRCKFATLENELHFKTKYNKERTRAKTTERINIAYDEIVSVIKQVIAVLKETATETQKTSAESVKTNENESEKETA